MPNAFNTCVCNVPNHPQPHTKNSYWHTEIHTAGPNNTSARCVCVCICINGKCLCPDVTVYNLLECSSVETYERTIQYKIFISIFSLVYSTFPPGPSHSFHFPPLFCSLLFTSIQWYDSWKIVWLYPIQRANRNRRKSIVCMSASCDFIHFAKNEEFREADIETARKRQRV